jgi:hypothetical protein
MKAAVVLPEHGDVWNLLDGHEGGGDVGDFLAAAG